MAKNKGLTTLLAAAAISLFGEGCFVSRAPYAYVEIDTPHPQSVVVVHQAPMVAAPVQVGDYQPIYADCVQYAASAADSMRPDGRRVEACTCYQPDPVTGQPDTSSAERCYRYP
jgi:hypothetical protein